MTHIKLIWLPWPRPHRGGGLEAGGHHNRDIPARMAVAAENGYEGGTSKQEEKMTDDIAAIVRELKDRQEILDCLLRYCRGVDRFDREAVRSAYHPDAIDDHGDFAGGVEDFIDWAFDYHTRYQLRTLHSISNHLCELDGDVAHSETYWNFTAVNKEPPIHSTSTGRYIDRLERRNGKWGIVRRICVMNGIGPQLDPDGALGETTFVKSLRNGSDPAYMRPLQVDLSRLTPKPAK